MTAIFTVRRDELKLTRWLEVPPRPLQDGEARLAIDRFALTANNVTYGAFGDAMGYWQFFPVAEEGWGCIPVWGFATVADSRVEGVTAGDRYYGYFPMADDVTLQPARVDEAGFVDGAAHRSELHGVYNRYVRCAADPLYRPEDEALLALLRPLFTTSFLIDDFIADSDDFGAQRILISSASSKTAYGLGFCRARRAAGDGPHAETVGLTSSGNVGFTEGLGCYDRVVAYEAVTTLSADEPAMYVDMSGDAALRATVHGHWRDRLRHSCAVGGTHWQELGSGQGLPGPRPVLFFAPAQVKKRQSDWGTATLAKRLAEGWGAFVARVRDPHAPWLRVVSGAGHEAVESTYRSLVEGRVPAVEGRILSV